ncbi:MULTISPECIES: calcium-binding protein [unclassified Microcoleus]|uniref:calcium-binding protein n=1 Tax=unclassified Microcoleus TaxID=2642155 RepID=UPI0025CE5E4D|nr:MULTISPECIES: calcium-binding protein [unclassified Microcoleus]
MARIRGTFNDDLLEGTPDNDTLSGLAGNDTLYGRAGDDELDGGSGADKMYGGSGNDKYIVDNIADIVVENTAEGIDLVESTVSYTLGANVEDLHLKGTAAIDATGNNTHNAMVGNDANNSMYGLGDRDYLFGAGGNDFLDGGDGDDQIYGGTGDDIIYGRAGADDMNGGSGNDLYLVDNVADLVTEKAAEGTDTVVTSTISYTLGANVENLTLSDAADIDGTGNELNNYMLGNAGKNFIKGEGGDDQINGRGGNDIIRGDNGNDTLTGDTGNDFVFGDKGNDILYGNDGNDQLLGGGGNDTLNGGNGNDILTGGGDIDPAGNNILWGGAGADGFRFYFAPTGIDTIKDFQVSEVDKIEIHRSFGATSLDQFSYSKTTGDLFFGQVKFATLENKPADFLVSRDIVLLP